MNSLKANRVTFLSIGAGCGVIALAGSFAISPAFAGRVVSDSFASHNQGCSNGSPCLAGSNKGAGAGVKGYSQGGYGVLGQTALSSVSTGSAGVSGIDLATATNNNVGVFGQSSGGIGVRALADTGTALLADANGGNGVFGTTQSNLAGLSSAGVFGEDVGSSSLASGVTGFSRTGIGVQGDNFEAGKYLNAAFLGLTFSSSLTTYFPALPPGALFNSDIGEGVVAETSGSQGEALAAANFGGGPVMRGYQGRTEVMELDNGGNMILAGKLTQQGNPGSATHAAGGTDVVMYAPVQTVATVEDLGEARLTAGQAYVRVDPHFSATMSSAHPYMVFITPQGDSSGLYVTQKTPAGFYVREHGGQSSIAFDYRIVGEPLGSQPARLTSAPRLTAHGFGKSFTRHKSDLLQSRGLIVQH